MQPRVADLTAAEDLSVFMKRWFLLALLVVCIAGCREKAAPPREGVAATRTDAGADGLCEHHVLQAICTRCNPKLAAVFQAKGDWCGEHGFPESVCPNCHPERGGRPERDVSVKPEDVKPVEDLPADGLKVRLKTKDAARIAGIENRAAESRNVGEGVTVVTRVAYDAKRLAQINARSRGVVRSLHADLGTKVAKGAALVEIESSEVGADRSRLGAAASRVETAQKNFDRVRSLRSDALATERDLLDARRELDAAKGEHAVLASSLSVAGAGGGTGGVYTLTAPLAGVVTRRGVTIGKLVGTDEVLFEIVDTRAMWADLDIPERSLPSIRAGQEALIRFDGLPERQFRGRLDFVSPELDARTRTASARVPLDNGDGSLRANMFGQARILTDAARTGVFVPAAVVVQLNVRDRDVGSFVAEAKARIEREVDLPTGYYFRFGGQFEHLERAQQRLLIVVPGALVLILVLLYFTYGRLVDALRVFMGVPFAAIGGVFALWLRGIPFSVSAAVGFIALSGVAVLGDMVLVSTVRQLVTEGVSLHEAVMRAAERRVRPVLMTALVASVGFLPMALNTGIGAEVQEPLATVVIGGIVSSTLLTLIVLPALFELFGSPRARSEMRE